ncbi:hypothetical protein WDU94_008750 [Cyamophila willieti]
MSTLLLKAILLLGIIGMIASNPSDPCDGTTPDERHDWSDGIHYVLKSSLGFRTFKEFLETRSALKSKVSYLESLRDNFDREDWDEVRPAYNKFKDVLMDC